MLITKRTLSNTFIIFVGGLLGSIFGIMGVIRSVMKYSEVILVKWKDKIKKKIKFKDLKKSKKEIKEYFNKKKRGREMKIETTHVVSLTFRD